MAQQEKIDKNRRTGKNVVNIPDNVLYGGKVPPHSRELEMNVLGGVIIDNSLIDLVANEGLVPKMFYITANSLIFRRINALRARGETVDLITLTEELKAAGELEAIGGPYYLAELSTAFSSQESIVFSANKIIENWQKRDLILASYSINEQAYDPTVDVNNLLTKAKKDIEEISMAHTNGEPVHFDLATDMEDIMKVGEPKVKTYYDCIDNEIWGFYGGELIIIAGRPSHGKTALMNSIEVNNSLHGVTQGIFSVEQSKRELASRRIAQYTGINSKRILRNKLDATEEKIIQRYVKNINACGRTYIYDDIFLYSHIINKIRYAVIKLGAQIIYVDYLGLLELDYHLRQGNRTLDVGFMTRGFKLLAKELDIPIVLLSQLNRKNEERLGKSREPQLSDIRDSGSVEQDADVVIFPYREDRIRKPSEAKIIIAKYRNGDVGGKSFHYEKTLTRFSERDPDTGQPLQGIPWLRERDENPF